jgi:hypothetical protein
VNGGSQQEKLIPIIRLPFDLSNACASPNWLF